MEINFKDESYKNICEFIDIELDLCNNFTPAEKKKDLYIAMIIFGMGALSSYNPTLDNILKDKLAEILKFLSDHKLIATKI